MGSINNLNSSFSELSVTRESDPEFYESDCRDTDTVVSTALNNAGRDVKDMTDETFAVNGVTDGGQQAVLMDTEGGRQAVSMGVDVGFQSVSTLLSGSTFTD